MDLEEDYISIKNENVCKRKCFYLLLYSLKFIVLVIPK